MCNRGPRMVRRTSDQRTQCRYMRLSPFPLPPIYAPVPFPLPPFPLPRSTARFAPCGPPPVPNNEKAHRAPMLKATGEEQRGRNKGDRRIQWESVVQPRPRMVRRTSDQRTQCRYMRLSPFRFPVPFPLPGQLLAGKEQNPRKSGGAAVHDEFRVNALRGVALMTKLCLVTHPLEALLPWRINRRDAKQELRETSSQS